MQPANYVEKQAYCTAVSPAPNSISLDICASNNALDSFMLNHFTKFQISSLTRPSCVSLSSKTKIHCKAGLFARRCLTKQCEMYLIKNPANNKVIISQLSVWCHMVTEQVGRTNA